MADSTPEWMENLPSELQESNVLTRIPDVETLAKNLLEKDKVIDGSIRLPGEDDASKLKFAERLDTLGFGPKQEVPDEYDLKAPGDEDWQKEWLSTRTEFYKAAGLTQKQAELALAEDRKALDSYAEDMKATTQALQQEHGEGLKTKLESANKVVEKFGLEKIAKSPFGATKEWNDFMIKMGEQMNEDGKINGTGAATPSADEIKLEEAELFAEMSRLEDEGKLTQGSPEAAAFELKRQKFLAKKYGNENFIAENTKTVDKAGMA